MKLKFKLKSDADVCLIQGSTIYLMSKHGDKESCVEILTANKGSQLVGLQIQNKRTTEIEINPAQSVYSVDRFNLNEEIVIGLESLDIDWKGYTSEKLIGHSGMVDVEINPQYIIPTGEYKCMVATKMEVPTPRENKDCVLIEILDVVCQLPKGDYFDETGAEITYNSKGFFVRTPGFYLMNRDIKELNSVHRILADPMAYENKKVFHLCGGINKITYADKETVDMLIHINIALRDTDTTNNTAIMNRRRVWAHKSLTDTIIESLKLVPEQSEEEMVLFINDAVKEWRITEAEQALSAKYSADLKELKNSSESEQLTIETEAPIEEIKSKAEPEVTQSDVPTEETKEPVKRKSKKVTE